VNRGYRTVFCVHNHPILLAAKWCRVTCG